MFGAGDFKVLKLSPLSYPSILAKSLDSSESARRFHFVQDRFFFLGELALMMTQGCWNNSGTHDISTKASADSQSRMLLFTVLGFFYSDD